MTPYIEDAIRRAAEDAGEDPAFALAVAERESDGNPNAHASRTIYGLYQMSAPLRYQYGVGNSTDPYEQASGWMRFIGQTRQGLTDRLGREPTASELYYAHHFGESRAAHMIGGSAGGNTPVSDVFTPYERALNPHFDRAGTTGNLMRGIDYDVSKRMQRYGGDGTYQGRQPIDFASYGVTQDGGKGSAQPIDFASYGTPLQKAGSPGAPDEMSNAQRLDDGYSYDAKGVNSIAGITRDLGNNIRADWNKFGREARPSTNVEDNRAGNQSWIDQTPRPNTTPEGFAKQSANPEDLGLTMPPDTNSRALFAATAPKVPLPRSRPSSAPQQLTDDELGAGRPGTEVDPSEYAAAY